jgi:hypothetical protein
MTYLFALIIVSIDEAWFFGAMERIFDPAYDREDYKPPGVY